VSDLVLSDVVFMRGAQRVIDGVSVRFVAGRLTAVIGPNGAGKSTLLSLAAGLSRCDRGAVRLGDMPLASIARRRLAQRRAYLPQNPRADWPISVERLVALGLTPTLPGFGRLPPEFQSKVDAALLAHDLIALRDRPATALSGGELARAMLARATVGDPEVLIVDEPTAGLDPRHAIDAVRRLRRDADAGRTVVMAIHDLALALRVADDVVAIQDGRILAAGPAETIFTSALLGRLFDVPVRVVRDADGAAVRFLD
jgi:iron complex transport system ATP-binding protein